VNTKLLLIHPLSIKSVFSNPQPRCMDVLAAPLAPVGGISYSLEDQAVAALMLSAALARRGIAHAYIGGFACALLGSERATQDIDVLLAHQGLNVSALRAELVRESPRFAQNTLKLFFISVRAAFISQCRR
jgi:hypothetical protein